MSGQQDTPWTARPRSPWFEEEARPYGCDRYDQWEPWWRDLS
jgi:hypothetical protein